MNGQPGRDGRRRGFLPGGDALPWAFKLLTGPIRDRYQLSGRGRHEPRALAAQIRLTLSLLGLILIEDPAEQVGVLMGLITSFAAIQDVAFDGRCINLTSVPT